MAKGRSLKRARARRRLGPRETAVRDLINDLNDGGDYTRREWFQICAAMDALGDTALVLDSGTWRRKARSFPALYLRLYGLLQAIHALQDAVEFLVKQLGGYKVKRRRGSATEQLRVLRNEIVAHQGPNAGSVSRMSLGGSAIQVMRWPRAVATHRFETVPFDQLVDKFVDEAATELDGLIAVLNKRVAASRR